MKKPTELTDSSQVDRNMPLRLEVAAKLMFPDGSIGASGLRTEAKKGRLVMVRIANKDMVTLAEIEKMIERCYVQPRRVPADAPPRPTPKPLVGQSKDERFAKARAAGRARLEQLREKLEGPASQCAVSSPTNSAPPGTPLRTPKLTPRKSTA